MSAAGQLASSSTASLASASGKWWILSGLWFLYASFGLVVTSIAPLVIPIETSLNFSHAAMGSIMGAWQLVYIGAAIPCGVLLDRLGGRWALLIGVGVITLSALGRAYAVDYWTFLLAVMLFGVGGPIISSGAPKVVASLFEGKQRGLAMGIYMTGPAIGGVCTLTLTHAWLMPVFDNNWTQVMLLWTAVCVLAGVYWFAVTWLTGFSDRPDSAQKVGMSQTAVMRELLMQRAVRVVLVMSVGVFLFNHGLNNWLPELLKGHGMTAIEAGYWAALPTVVGVIGSLLIPRLATPERRFAILAALCGAALVASLLLQAHGEFSLTTGLILQGIARSSMMTVLILTLVELPGIGEQRAGVASGMFFSAAEIGGVLGPLGLGVAYELSGGFSSGLLALSVVAGGLVLASVYLGRLARPGRTSEPQK